jgi:hypothetical protein
MSKGPEVKPDQQRRLSVALRENLRRRKAQAKGRAAAGDGVGKAGGGPHDSAGIAAEKDAAGPR